jgi:hypothetical protein
MDVDFDADSACMIASDQQQAACICILPGNSQDERELAILI